MSNTTAPTQFITTRLETYACRRFGAGASPPLVCLQHFTGTLDNWDPAVTDPLAQTREVILFESAGLGRSTGEVPSTVAAMAAHLLAFVDALGLTLIDLLGFSLGGMVAQQAALERPPLVRKMLLVGTAPEGGEDIMHLEKPVLRRDGPSWRGSWRARRIGSPPRVQTSRQRKSRHFVRGSESMASDSRSCAGSRSRAWW